MAQFNMMQNSTQHSPLFKAVVVVAGISALISVCIIGEFPKRMLNDKLLAAAQDHDVDQMKLLLRVGANINSRDRDPNGDHTTVLMRAVESGDIESIELLIDKGVNVNASNNVGQTALIEAVSVGSPEIANILLNHGANINYYKAGTDTALETAALNMRIDLARMLISRGADIKIGTPLLDACYDGDHFDKDEQVRLIKFLISKGADVDARSEEGYTALGMASYWNEDKAVKVLRKAGAVDHGAPIHLDPPAEE